MYFTCGYRHCIRTSAGPFFGVIQVYRAPTVSVSPQKKARPRGTDGMRPGAGTFGPNDTNTTSERSVRSLTSKAAPWGIDIDLARPNIVVIVRREPQVPLGRWPGKEERRPGT